MPKKKTESEEDILYIEGQAPVEPPVSEGLPEWMATFADMVTLLLCFFVLLLSFANQDIQNYEKMKGAIQEAFGVQTTDTSAMHAAFAETAMEYQTTSKEKQEIARLAQSINTFAVAQEEKTRASVATDSQGIMLRVDNRVVFLPGSAELTPPAKAILDDVVKLMGDTDFNLMVRGHTSDEEPHSEFYRSNWELSATRAAACLRYILDHSTISPRRCKAVGFADSRPLVPNNSPENRRINQRVEFYYQAPGAPF